MLRHLIERFELPRPVLPLLMALALGFGSPAMADDDDGPRSPPRVASIDALLATVQRDYPGRVLKVELEREDDGRGRWMYEVKVLTSTGNVVEIEIDAVSLERLRVEGDRSRRPDDD